ncbi:MULTISPECIES: hypothetical protein [Methanosarcina]|uniref:Uncharacterized protein n=2 Tax=Methanosarcina barkeri TaxID=2208 RepID=A0A0E3QWJ2_METBA|nr:MULTISPECIES: hypothetical protein [Methanosarcina]AKB55200.1 hypothetical protein MSBRM_2202 [Methanosarcina barkeri MS]AKB56726.1 hypothetical protein MSBR2_0210 [Methanosarcina barkeri 227]OED01066.1 hypothetical protein A9239_15200 [Methanosarcina sp. A14]
MDPRVLNDRKAGGLSEEKKKKIKSRKEPTFRKCLQKNNIFLVIVFGELLEKSAVIISTEASEMCAGNFQ